MVVGGAAQVLASVAIGPSYLTRGFWALLSTPLDFGLHATLVGMIIILAFRAVKLLERLRGGQPLVEVPRAVVG
jgi:hypothetical protein